MAEINSFEKEKQEAAQAYDAGELQLAYNKYLKLAEAGHGDSQVFVGWMLENGIGVGVNLGLSKKWFKRAAELGSRLGQFYYALYLIRHNQQEEGFKWVTKAALRGDIPSIFRLGYMYIYGNGTEADLKKGLYYLGSAANQGHIYAKRELAVLDMKGCRGIVRRLLGPFNFLYTLILGLVTVRRDQYSDNLRR